jgi:hypothetical protein
MWLGSATKCHNLGFLHPSIGEHRINELDARGFKLLIMGGKDTSAADAARDAWHAEV